MLLHKIKSRTGSQLSHVADQPVTNTSSSRVGSWNLGRVENYLLFEIVDTLKKDLVQKVPTQLSLKSFFQFLVKVRDLLFVSDYPQCNSNLNLTKYRTHMKTSTSVPSGNLPLTLVSPGCWISNAYVAIPLITLVLTSFLSIYRKFY